MLTSAEARQLAVAAMPKEAKSRGVTIELDRDQNGCEIYHAYALGGIAAIYDLHTWMVVG